MEFNPSFHPHEGVNRYLTKLVNAYLDGTIEKDIYLAKKNELVQTKTDLNKRKSDFGRKGNNWIEPLKKWIIDANYAKKLALSKDFMEIKSFTEKIGTNRRLLSRKTEFEFVRPFDLIPKYRAFCEARPAEGGASEQQNNPEFEKSLSWSGMPDSNRRPHSPEPCALPTALIPVFYLIIKQILKKSRH